MTLLFWHKIEPSRYSTYELLRAAEIPHLQGDGVRITFDRGEYDTADAVVFNRPLMFWHREKLPPKRPGQVWVLFSLESELNHPWLKAERRGGMFDYRMSFHRDADVVTPYFNRDYDRKLRTMPGAKTGDVCMFISSRCNNSGREEYVRELMQYLDIDSYGRFMNNRRIGDDKGYTSKLDVVRGYKFCIAFENAIDDDYVTEKFYEPLMAGTVPVYMGAPNIAEYAPDAGAYLNVADFASPRELAGAIKRLCADDAEYGKFFEWKARPLDAAFRAHVDAQAEHPFRRLAGLCRRRAENPLVSVVIPAYNDTRVKEAVQSVLCQSWQGFEVIVVDDGSDADVGYAVSELTDTRVRYIRQEHSNANVARNRGISEARGDYIAFLDADDLWTPGHITGCLETLRREKADGLYGSITICNAADGSRRVFTASPPAAGESMAGYLLRTGYGAQTSSLFVSASSARQVMWDTTLLRHQDYDFVVRYAARCKFAVKGEPTVIHNTGHKRTAVDFASCMRFVEKNRRDIAPDVLKAYAYGMLTAAAAQRAGREAIEYYAGLMAGCPTDGSRKINLFLMDIQNGVATGVVRYMETLIGELKRYDFIDVHRVKFMINPQGVFFRDEGGGNYTVGYTPSSSGLLSEHRAALYYLMQDMFRGKCNIILHLHTMNLIELAQYIREKTGCRIISHIHCIPWRGLANGDGRKYARLSGMWHRCGDRSGDIFITGGFERKTYLSSDALICVSREGRRAVCGMAGMEEDGVGVIPNGLADGAAPTEGGRKDGGFSLLFVGGGSPAKGINYVLQAAELARHECNFTLHIAGLVHRSFGEEVRRRYPGLDIKLPGMLGQEQLYEYYRRCDAGIIASVQEQCSYAAIEMAMHGLPLICTRADGLEEMFSHGTEAVMVPMVYDSRQGRRPDIRRMAAAIVEVVNNDALRSKLSGAIRKRYVDAFTARSMAERTVEVYRKVAFME